MRQEFDIQDGILKQYYGKGGDVVVPEGVTQIKWTVFCQHPELISITLPEGITLLESCTFKNCTNLKSVSLPHSLTKIGWGAFNNCTALKSIHLPENVIHIDDEAFVGCVNLKKIIFSGEPNHIGKSIFLGCQEFMLQYQQYLFPNNPYLPEVLRMLRKKDFSIIRNNPGKAYLLFTLYFSYPDGEELFIYLQEHFIELFNMLNNNQYADMAKKIFRPGQFLTENNIDKLIRQAIEQNAYDIQLLLTDYKYQHLNFHHDLKL